MIFFWVLNVGFFYFVELVGYMQRFHIYHSLRVKPYWLTAVSLLPGFVYYIIITLHIIRHIILLCVNLLCRFTIIHKIVNHNTDLFFLLNGKFFMGACLYLVSIKLQISFLSANLLPDFVFYVIITLRIIRHNTTMRKFIMQI